MLRRPRSWAGVPRTAPSPTGAPLADQEDTMLQLLAHHPGKIRAWLAALFITGLLSGAAVVGAPARADAQSKPTVVLVHGAFADASGWSHVIGALQRRGYPVIAPANPLRGVSSDSAYLKNVLGQIEGSIVLVGHSYGGFVLTNAATGNPNVKALVYIAAYAPAEGDTVQSLTAHAPGSLLGPDSLTIRTFPTPDGQLAPEGYITPSASGRCSPATCPRPPRHRTLPYTPLAVKNEGTSYLPRLTR